MLDESFSPALGSQAESLSVGRVIPHNSKSIGRIRTVLKFLGPAFIVSVAYIDPANLKLEHFFFPYISAKNKPEGLIRPSGIMLLQAEKLKYQVNI
ncbi:hypothetical protein [Clostridium sp. BNL1100]|uniref:hypothetical protein n=1 Tax=Clostridium sp. BNL1100 TaxID=755731 RepID=UPI00024A769C|nr:hypothetical protein [Clostridium sp. BNL1100]AEY64770.1 hypothetical protein Clo1100_0489 [Clostridium sp. BNL1100]